MLVVARFPSTTTAGRQCRCLTPPAGVDAALCRLCPALPPSSWAACQTVIHLGLQPSVQRSDLHRQHQAAWRVGWKTTPGGQRRRLGCSCFQGVALLLTCMACGGVKARQGPLNPVIATGCSHCMMEAVNPAHTGPAIEATSLAVHACNCATVRCCSCQGVAMWEHAAPASTCCTVLPITATTINTTDTIA